MYRRSFTAQTSAGTDHNEHTCFHGGRYKQLSQVGDQVIKEIIA